MWETCKYNVDPVKGAIYNILRRHHTLPFFGKRCFDRSIYPLASSKNWPAPSFSSSVMVGTKLATPGQQNNICNVKIVTHAQHTTNVKSLVNKLTYNAKIATHAQHTNNLQRLVNKLTYNAKIATHAQHTNSLQRLVNKLTFSVRYR